MSRPIRSLSVSSQNIFSEHLNNVFKPLLFPQELAVRLLTHGSHKTAIRGHNARFSFIGRRVLEAYLLLFLQSSSALQPSHDLEHLTGRALNTYTLGKHLAPVWELGRVLQWAPPIPAKTLGTVGMEMKKGESKEEGVLTAIESTKSIGLYKVQGEAVQAVIGGIFHQFGGSIAHRVFHTRFLPHMLLPKSSDGLLDVFHDDALRACERMGGLEGNVVPDVLAGVDFPNESPVTISSVGEQTEGPRSA